MKRSNCSPLKHIVITKAFFSYFWTQLAMMLILNYAWNVSYVFSYPFHIFKINLAKILTILNSF